MEPQQPAPSTTSATSVPARRVDVPAASSPRDAELAAMRRDAALRRILLAVLRLELPRGG